MKIIHTTILSLLTFLVINLVNPSLVAREGNINDLENNINANSVYDPNWIPEHNKVYAIKGFATGKVLTALSNENDSFVTEVDFTNDGVNNDLWRASVNGTAIQFTNLKTNQLLQYNTNRSQWRLNQRIDNHNNRATWTLLPDDKYNLEGISLYKLRNSAGYCAVGRQNGASRVNHCYNNGRYATQYWIFEDYTSAQPIVDFKIAGLSENDYNVIIDGDTIDIYVYLSPEVEDFPSEIDFSNLAPEIITESSNYAPQGAVDFTSENDVVYTTLGVDNTSIEYKVNLYLPEILDTTEEVRFAKFSPDGEHIITGDNNGSIKIWDSKTLTYVDEIEFVIDGIFGPITPYINDVVYSSDGSTIFAVGVGAFTNAYVKSWDSSTREQIAEFDIGERFAYSLDFYENDNSLLVGGRDNVYLLNAYTLTETSKYPVESRSINNSFSRISPDGNSFFSGGVEGISTPYMDFIDIASGDSVFYELLSGHTDRLVDGEFNADGSIFITAGAERDRMVIGWDTSNGEQLFSISTYNRLNDIAWSSDDSKIATAGYNDSSDSYTSVELWDFEQKKSLYRYKIINPYSEVLSVDFSEDGNKLLVAPRYGSNVMIYYTVGLN